MIIKNYQVLAYKSHHLGDGSITLSPALPGMTFIHVDQGEMTLLGLNQTKEHMIALDARNAPFTVIHVQMGLYWLDEKLFKE